MEEHLKTVLDRARRTAVEVVDATEYAGRAAESASRPQKFLTRDARLFAVKFRNNRHGDGRALVAEHIAGSLGSAIMAPVADVALVRVSQTLLDAQPEPIRLEDDDPAEAGIHHGSAWVDDCFGPQGPQHLEANRASFAALNVLYTWLHCSNDQQFLYVVGSNAVVSVDHSPFLPDGPGGWTREALDAGHEPSADPVLSAIGLVQDDYSGALSRLRTLTVEDLAAPVGRVPEEWGLDDEDRLALLVYLLKRREAVIDLLE